MCTPAVNWAATRIRFLKFALAPLILFVHGGGWTQGAKGTANQFKIFFKQDYAVATIEYRLAKDAPAPAANYVPFVQVGTQVYISGQKRRVTDAIKRELRRRSAVEPVIGHLKTDHRMGRNFLAHSTGDAINVILAAVGYNFRRLLVWLRFIFAILQFAINQTRAKENQFSIA